MAYTAWSVTAFEQPTAAKWNILGTNDASFNDGTGIANGAITPQKRSGGYKIGTITSSTLSTTGNKSITGVGFAPKLVKFTSLQSGTGAINLSMGAMTAANQYYVSIIADSSTGRGRASGTDAAIASTNISAALSFKASYVSMDSDGFTINVSNNSSPSDWVYEAYG